MNCYDTDGYGYSSVYERCFDEGFGANENGDFRESCPYAHSSPEGREWLRGWDNCQKVRTEWEADMHDSAVLFGDA